MNMNGMGGQTSMAQQEAMARQNMKDVIRLFNETTSTCFETCVKSFMQKNLTSNEGECIEKCSKKFLSHQKRVGMRFSELNFELSQRQNAQAQQK